MLKTKKVIPELCRGFVISTIQKTYKERDVILYALGVGVSNDPMDLIDLQYTYENSPQFAALPSYAAVIPPIEEVFSGLLKCEGMPEFNPMMLLHAEERLKLFRPVPSSARVTCTTRIVDVIDKSKGATIIIAAEIAEENSTSPFCEVYMNLFIRGIGGFGQPAAATHTTPITKMPPDTTLSLKTTPNQAILYRLSGDTNPLHIDPNLARIGGFDRPILHGLCTFGIVVAALTKQLVEFNSVAVSEIMCKFVAPVIPGDALDVKVWIIGSREVLFEVETKTAKVAVGSMKFNTDIKIAKSSYNSTL